MSNSKKRREAKIAKADADGQRRWKVQFTYAFSKTFTVKALNEQQAVERIEQGFGVGAGIQQPEVVDVRCLDMSTAEAKGNMKPEENTGLIDVVSG
jgi:hypothetical protein